ncbi:hypothetical protein [Mycobacterium malmoense]|uniref:hypothetical protein n=1 Tax=Mycobacterium malmoense TaxID=1780 RepID=UPI0008F88347|nr:hypothetical protein [Mycobacterium malmoense]OIN79343.1 hypothetical protein BMG05_18320 [Mycobacterium malmoense]
MADFLALEEFTTEYGGSLTEAETPIATRLLQVVSDWIRSQAALYSITPDDDAAAQVVFEVVRDALRYGDFEKLSSFANTTSRKTESGTFDAAQKVIDDYLTPRHKRLLGIPVNAAPVGSFKACDY